MKRLFWTASLALAGILFFCTTQTVRGHEKQGQGVEEKYYEEWESAYLKEARQALERSGLENSGITMTRVTKEDGSRSYTVQIHHRRTAALAAKQRARLLKTLEELPFLKQECQFSYALSASPKVTFT